MPVRSVVLIFLLVFLAVGAEAREDDWIELRSANFVVYSDAKEEHARALITDLEYFRYFLQYITNVPNTEGTVPLTVYALKDSRSFNRIVRTSAVGLYVTQRIGPPVAYAKIKKWERGTGNDGRVVLFHEYVHHFLRQFSPYNYPVWYDEGFAEFLSTFSYENGFVSVGRIARNREVSLAVNTWMPIGLLLQTKRDYPSGPGTDAFYAQSWLLVHYLQSKPDLRTSLVNYLRAINLGEDVLEAYNRNFDMTRSDLMKALKKYKHSGKVSYTQYQLAEEPPAPSISKRKVSEPEAEYLVMIAHRNFEGAKDHLKTVRRAVNKINKRWPDFLLPYLLLAEEEFDHGSQQEGWNLLNNFLAQNPEHPHALWLLAHFEFQTALAMESGTEREAQFEIAGVALRQAIDADPFNIKALYEMGLLGLLMEEVDMLEPLMAMRDARLLIPANERVQMNFALLAAKAGYKPQARELLKDLVDWSRSDALLKEASGHLNRLTDETAE